MNTRMRMFLGGLMLGVTLTVLLWWPSGLFSQAPPGYTKVNSTAVTTTSYVDSTVVRAATYQYVVTAFNAAAESGPSNVFTGTVPDTTATHSASLSWGASVGATGYNVYRFLVQPPAAPTGLTGVFN